MAQVTVPGSTSGSTLTLTFLNTFNTALANAISSALGAASLAGTLNVITANNDGAGGATLSGSAISGDVNELLILPGFTGAISVPASAGFQYVIDDSTGSDTVYGSPSLSIAGAGGAHWVFDPAVITLGDTSAGSTNIVSTTGAGDNVAVGDGTNTVVGTGGGTISGGTGQNTFDVSTATGVYTINSIGQGDSVKGGAQQVFVNALSIAGGGGTSKGGVFRAGTGGIVVDDSGGRAETILGAAGGATVTASGGAATVIGAAGALNVDMSASFSMINNAFGAGAANATVSGTSDYTALGGGPGNFLLTSSSGAGLVIGEGAGALSVEDQGSKNAIVAVGSPTGNITLAGSGAAFVDTGSSADSVLASGSANVDYGNFYGTDATATFATVTGSGNAIVVGNSLGGGGSVDLTSTSSKNFVLQFGTGTVNVTDAASNADGSGNFLSPGYDTSAGAVFNAVLTGSGDTIAAGPAETNVTVQGAGDAVVVNLGGPLNFVGGSGGATVQAYNFTGAGNAGTTIFGSVGGDNVAYSSQGSAGGLFYQAGLGNETLDASGSTNTDTLAGGAGSVTMTAGSGLTTFLFATSADGGSAPKDLVNGFSGSDTVNLQGYASGSGSVTAGAGGSAVLSLSDGTQITFSNTGTTALSNAIHYT